MLYAYNGQSYPNRFEMCAARRRHYVELVRGGMNFSQAARAVGVSKRTGRVWRNGRRRASGRHEKSCVDLYSAAMKTPKPISSRFLSEDERVDIADLLVLKKSQAEIARALGRSPSTISREIRRGRDPDTGAYRPYQAQERAENRRARPKPRKLDTNPRLRQYVQKGLLERWSPEQITRRLRQDWPEAPDMRVCVETIYQAIYVQGKGALKRELVASLRRGHGVRKPQRQGDARQPRFRDPMVHISERPACVADRAVPGHWEGDLILGAGGKSAIGTLVERSTRFAMLLRLPNGHDSGQVQEAIVRKMRQLPQLLRQSLTWDQGSEMAQHVKIGFALGMQVYFCDPHSPWQKGTNENTNGLLRQYFPKGSNLSGHSEDVLDAVAAQLNDRPRKTLGWATPNERFRALLQTAAASQYVEK